MPLVLLFLLLFGCGKPTESPTPSVVPFSGVAMTVPYNILVRGPLSEQDIAAVENIIHYTFDEVNVTFNKYTHNSELSKINRMDAFVSVQPSESFLDLLKICSEVVAISDGRFDPTVEPAMSLWREHLRDNCKPTRRDLENIAHAVGWKHLHISDGNLWKDHPETSMDFGGVAKGLAVDMLAERLVRAGFANCLVEWGGEIRAEGNRLENTPWTVSISIDNSNSVEVIPLCNQAIATSGDSYQRYTVGGITYTHIINPKTVNPIIVGEHPLCAATVIAPSCVLADALATAAILFEDIEEANCWREVVSSAFPGVTIQFFMLESKADSPLLKRSLTCEGLE